MRSARLRCCSRSSSRHGTGSAICASLASALAQRGVELEVIVSDDGSDDGTVDFVRSVPIATLEFGCWWTIRIRASSRTSRTHSQRRAGDAFTILSDDDILDPDFCRRLWEPMEADPTVVLTFCDHRTIDEHGRLMERATLDVSRRYGRASLPDGPVADQELVACAVESGSASASTDARASSTSDSIRPAGPRPIGITPSVRRNGVESPTWRRCWGDYRDHHSAASRQGLRNESDLAMRVLSKHMRDPIAERARRNMLRAAASRNAYQMAAVDRGTARRSLMLYRSLGGSPRSLHGA